MAGGYLHVVVRGTDNGIYHKKFNLTTETWDLSWTNLGGATLSTPALATCPIGSFDWMYLFVRGTDNGIYYKYWREGLWTTWYSIPSATNDIPALCILYPDENFILPQLHLVVRGTDNGIYYNRWTGSWLASWVNVSGATNDRPDLYASNILYLHVRGADNGVYYKTMVLSTYVWLTSWMKWPGATSSGPTIEAGLVIVRGTDNGLYYIWLIL